MPRIACIVAAAAATAITASAADDALAASRNEHRHASSHHASRPGAVTPSPVRTTVIAYAPAYRPSSSTASRQSPSPSRSSTPPVYFVPALSPNAPPFSFSESEAQPGWNWQRVSLQQIDAEVRAKRDAQARAKAPAGPATQPVAASR